RYNPVAESHMGAKGLMQVIPKFHGDKLTEHGGESALLDPHTNIQVGAQILREYLRRFGETETALQMYAGAFDEPNSSYALKVLAERSRLEQMLPQLRRGASTLPRGAPAWFSPAVPPDPLCRLLEVGHGAGIGKAHVALRSIRAEVDPRRRRDDFALQQVEREEFPVARAFRVDVERARGRCGDFQPRVPQCGQQEIAPAFELPPPFLQDLQDRKSV